MDQEQKTDGLFGDSEPKQQIEDLLLLIGGCEVAIRNNAFGKFGASPVFQSAVKKKQQEYLKKLERVVNGLPEENPSH
jgi:hypothetical protein